MPLGPTQDDLQDSRDRDQLCGQYRQCSHPNQRCDDATYSGVVTQIQEIAHRLEVVAFCQFPDLGADCVGQNERSDTGRSHPPPRGQSELVSDARRSHRRTRTDIGCQERRKNESGSQIPTRYQKSRGMPNLTGDDEAENDDAYQVGEEESQLEGHPSVRIAPNSAVSEQC